LILERMQHVPGFLFITAIDLKASTISLISNMQATRNLNNIYIDPFSNSTSPANSGKTSEQHNRTRTLAYDLHHVAQSLNRLSLSILHSKTLMDDEPSLIQHPSGFLWGAAIRAAARHRFRISMRCESALKERLKSGLELNKVGMREFTDRKSEAQSNVEKLIAAMINAQLAKDPTVDVLDAWTIHHALDEEKLCPGLWSIC
jgi:hypothetical protein